MSRDRTQRVLPRGVLAAAIVGIVLAGATSFLVYPVLTGDRAVAPVVVIHEPQGWAAEGARAIEVDQGAAVPIRGVARHIGPITDVRLNGRRLARESVGEGVVEFGGFLNAADVGPQGAFTLEVRGLGDAVSSRHLPVRIRPTSRAPAFADVDRGERSQRWAVIIGADDRAAADALALADFLRSPAAGLGGFDADHVRLLVGDAATGRAIRSGLKTFLRAPTPGDLVVIFLAGRLLTDPLRPGLAYLAATDTDPADIPATGIPLSFLAEAIEEVYGHNRLVLADLTAPPAAADLAATFLRDGTLARQGGLAVLATTGVRPGALTARVLDGLGGAADQDGDGIVRLGELVAHGGDAGFLVAPTSFDTSWPLAAVGPRTALAAPAPRPDT